MSKNKAGSNNSLGKVLPIAKDVPILPPVELSDDELLEMLSKRRDLQAKVTGKFIQSATTLELNSTSITVQSQKDARSEVVKEKVKTLWATLREHFLKDTTKELLKEIFLLEEKNGKKAKTISSNSIQVPIDALWNFEYDITFNGKRVKRPVTATT